MSSLAIAECCMVPHLPLLLFLQGNGFLIVQNPLVLHYLMMSDHKAGLHPYTSLYINIGPEFEKLLSFQ